MEFENSTSDDAMIKVSGGSGIPKGNPPTQEGWLLPRKKKLSLSSLPTGSVIHLFVEVSPQTVMSDTIKSLKLTKDGTGYAIKVMKNDSGRRRKS